MNLIKRPLSRKINSLLLYWTILCILFGLLYARKYAPYVDATELIFWSKVGKGTSINDVPILGR